MHHSYFVVVLGPLYKSPYNFPLPHSPTPSTPSCRMGFCPQNFPSRLWYAWQIGRLFPPSNLHPIIPICELHGSCMIFAPLNTLTGRWLWLIVICVERMLSFVLCYKKVCILYIYLYWLYAYPRKLCMKIWYTGKFLVITFTYICDNCMIRTKIFI